MFYIHNNKKTWKFKCDQTWTIEWANKICGHNITLLIVPYRCINCVIGGVGFCDLKRALNRWINFNAPKWNFNRQWHLLQARTMREKAKAKEAKRNEWAIVPFWFCHFFLFFVSFCSCWTCSTTVAYVSLPRFSFFFFFVWPLIFLSIECVSRKFFSAWRHTNEMLVTLIA